MSFVRVRQVIILVIIVSLGLVGCATKKRHRVAAARVQSEVAEVGKVAAAQEPEIVVVERQVLYAHFQLFLDVSYEDPKDFNAGIMMKTPRGERFWRFNWNRKGIDGLVAGHRLAEAVVGVVNYTLIGDGVVRSMKKAPVSVEFTGETAVRVDEFLTILGLKGDRVLRVRVLGRDVAVDFSESRVYPFDEKLTINGKPCHVIANLVVDGKGAVSAAPKSAPMKEGGTLTSPEDPPTTTTDTPQ